MKTFCDIRKQAIDEFRKTFKQTLSDMENLYALLSGNKFLRASEADQELKFCTQIHGQVQRSIESVIEMGKFFLY